MEIPEFHNVDNMSGGQGESHVAWKFMESFSKEKGLPWAF